MNILLDGMAYVRDALRDEQQAELNDWLRRQPCLGRVTVQRFQLVRHDSASAVVAEGEEFDDGSVALHWVGGRAIETLPGVEAVRRRLCTNGRIAIRWRVPFADNDWNDS